jgi:glutathione S-transferase
MYTLYQMPESGNCYKIRLLMNQLNVERELVNIDILNGESRTAEFLKMNSNGRVPLLKLANGSYLAESNAILCYLADGSELLPDQRLQRALVLQWLFFEQYSHEPFIATSRYWISILKQPEKYASELQQKKQGGYAALDVMEKHLISQDFFVDQRYSIADIALFAYTHLANEGDFDLSAYPAINNWIARVQQQTGHLTIKN